MAAYLVAGVAVMLRDRLTEIGVAREFGAGETVFDQGQTAGGAYVVLSGRACLTLLDPADQPIWSRILGAGSILGLPSSVSGQPYSLRATTLEPTRAVFVSRDSVNQLMRQDPVLAAEILRVLSDELIDLRKKMSMLRSRPVTSA